MKPDADQWAALIDDVEPATRSEVATTLADRLELSTDRASEMIDDALADGTLAENGDGNFPTLSVAGEPDSNGATPGVGAGKTTPQNGDSPENPVPDVLTSRNQWVCWREEERDGELTKVPVNASTGRKAKSDDSDTWTSFEKAREFHEHPDTDTEGIGYMFSSDGTLAGVDLDGCRDPDTGRPDETAKDIIDELDSYTEVSPSGTGYHVYVHGFVPEGGNRRDGVEMYDERRFFTVTGEHVEGTPGDVNQRADVLREIHAEYIDDGDDGTNRDTPDPPDTGDVDLDDQDLIEKAKNAENGDKFRRLWNGDTSGYPSHSEADLALAGLLAFWSGGDRRRIDDLFRRSELYREKWDRDDYRERTIEKALEGRSEFYDSEGGGRRDRDDGAGDSETGTGRIDRELYNKFMQACNHYQIDFTTLGTEQIDGETQSIGLHGVLPGRNDATLDDAVMAFNRNADLLDGTDRQAVIGRVVLLDLLENGEFFNTPNGLLFYFFDPEKEVYRADGDGNRILAQDFQGMVWDRYNLFAGRFSRNLGADLQSQARRNAPTKDVYQFAHFNREAGELYVSDWESGYYAVSPEGIEWRANGTDVYFLSDDRAEPYTYLQPNERPELPDSYLPGERPVWGASGDPLMRLFGNRINFSEDAALTPVEQRKQLYLHLHTLPFIDLLNSRPIMAWVGEKGSGKTVIERSIGLFVYGEDYRESIMPDGKDDFLAKVTNQALAFLDNYDDGVDWANDVLAAVATGAGIDKRELYSTNDLRRETPRCWLSITSRDPPFRRDDVADRTLVFRVKRIEDNEFVGMADYLRQVIKYRDLLWSEYLDNLQKIVSEREERDTAGMNSSHRMADWAIFAKITADALNVDHVEELLETMETERATFALENETFAAVIADWVRDAPDDAATWRKADSMVEKLQEVANDQDRSLGITTPQGMGSKLSNYRSELEKLYGLEIDNSGRVNRYRFTAGVDGTEPSGLDRF